MLNKSSFEVINQIYKHGYKNQRAVAEGIGWSLGKCNQEISALKELMLLDSNNELTEAAYQEMENYRVKNAIIMAAGMSSRFAPLSYEKPKGLLEVKGEILIERQIRQLHEAGIKDVTVIVGYKKEQFFYLEDLCDVQIIINEDYYKYNNTSSLIRVLEKLDNTYICSSDNYFEENVFEQYVYDSYYSAVYIEGESDEFGIEYNNKNQITGINHTPKDMWCMMGHVYFSKSFSRTFKELLQKEFYQGETRYELWEKLLERNLDVLQIFIRKYDSNVIKEFDSLEELREFDNKYIDNTGSVIFDNICKTLKCEQPDIVGIEVIKQGLTNLSFKFKVHNDYYVYRHPGVGTEKYISRRSEAFSMTVAKELGLDDTFVAMDSEQGWKISRFIPNARMLNYRNTEEVDLAIQMMRMLHDQKIKSEYEFGIWTKTKELIDKIESKQKDFSDFEKLNKSIEHLVQITEQDGVEKVLCHCDCYSPNFIIGENNKMYLIDWEYSGNDDPGCDIGTFICCSDLSYEESIDVIKKYYGKEMTEIDYRHTIAYVAIASYYWYVWAMFQESIGNKIGEFLYLWYKNSKLYYKKAIELYEQE